jgi:hypothetical protein
VQEIRVQTAEVAGEEQEVGRRDVPRMQARMADLETPDGQESRGIHPRLAF